MGVRPPSRHQEVLKDQIDFASPSRETKFFSDCFEDCLLHLWL